MKRFALLALALIPAYGAFLASFAEVTGTGAAVALTTNTQTLCSYIQIIAPAANSAVVRFGDSTVSATVGLPIAAGGGYNTPVIPGSKYAMSAQYVYVANNDKVDFACGN